VPAFGWQAELAMHGFERQAQLPSGHSAAVSCSQRAPSKPGRQAHSSLFGEHDPPLIHGHDTLGKAVGVSQRLPEFAKKEICQFIK